jgi:CubicO group peptidase (beta-lactamase class C family)
MKKIILLFAAVLAWGAARSQNTDRASADFNALTSVYNTNDTAAYAAFFTKVLNDPRKIKANVNQMSREFRFIGPVTLKKIKAISATEIDLTFQTKNFGSWWTLMWITDSVKNFKEHHMRPARFSGDFLLQGQLSQNDILKTVDEYIDQLVDKKLFAGNVLIARNGQLLYNKSFGATPTGKPNDANVAFSLASMSKLFTTVSILQLVDAHKISLDDSVAKLLPQLKNKALYPITVRQLLTHTSGMGDYFEDPLFDPFKGRKFTRQDALPAVEKDKLHFPPGTSFGYSNTGFELLGLIVEKVSATPLESYIRQHVFEKVGMNHSTFGVASGGSEATIGDMYNFSQTLLSNKLLTPATTAYFFNYHTTDWGLGEEYQQLGSEVITGHSGGFEGVCTELNMYKNSGYTVIILSNTNPPYGHFLSDRIKETIIRK